MSYVSVSRTPEPSAIGTLAFRKAVLPAHRLTEEGGRNRFSFGAREQVGEILDLSRGRCALVRLGFSVKHDGIYARRDTCGGWDCPYCVELNLMKLAAPYVYWLGNGGAAVRAEFPDVVAWDNARKRKFHVTMQGDNATPGVVNLPVHGAETRVVWAPVGVIEGDKHFGTDLDQRFARDVRAVPLPPTKMARAQHQAICNGCERTDLHRPVREAHEITVHELKRARNAMEAIGLTPLSLSKTQYFGKVSGTREQFEELRAALRG